MPTTSTTPQRLEDMNVGQLKNLLKLEGLPVGGRKTELIARLRAYSGKPKPEVDWQYSKAKKQLKKQLLDPNSSVHTMAVDDVWNSDPGYKQYPMFPLYFAKLKERVKEEKKAVKDDDKNAEYYLQTFPRSLLNKRGYPYWDMHRAKELLEKDVANKLHETMSAYELRKMRSEFMEFPKKVFAKHVHAEVTKQKAKGFWAHDRNKKGMKKYLKQADY